MLRYKNVPVKLVVHQDPFIRAQRISIICVRCGECMQECLLSWELLEDDNREVINKVVRDAFESFYIEHGRRCTIFTKRPGIALESFPREKKAPKRLVRVIRLGRNE